MDPELLNLGALNHTVIEGLRGAQNRQCELLPLCCDSILQHLEGEKSWHQEGAKTTEFGSGLHQGGAGLGCTPHEPRETQQLKSQTGDALSCGVTRGLLPKEPSEPP